MENELVFGILTRDGVLWLVLGMFVFTMAIIIYAMVIAPMLSLSRDKKSKLTKGAKGSEV